MPPNNIENLVIISNRLPIVITKNEEKLTLSAGSGGLVTALAPILKNSGGTWIGWPGPVLEEEKSQISALLDKENQELGYHFFPVFLTEEELKFYYEGFSNEIIWPLFHDLLSKCHFDPTYWHFYNSVNAKFAAIVAEKSKKNGFIWIHDYQLMLVGQKLRQLGCTETLAFFLHIPFPSPDIFFKLPWRFELLRALLEFDLIGFQTARDLRNFVHCVKKLLPNIILAYKRPLYLCSNANRKVRCGAFPISIDFEEFSHSALLPEVETLIKTNQQNFSNREIIFSCDRLDFSKGIPNRLEAIRFFLKNYPQFHQKVTFFQVVIPSRVEIPKYASLKNQIDRLVGEINSEFTQTGWIPIHYLFHSISRHELLAFYRKALAILITPIKDGMNLVAKEYIAANSEEEGVVILSEFAGAATQLQNEALLINPYDIEGVAKAIYTALTMERAERKKRMHKMRRGIKKNNVFYWLSSYLNAAKDKEIKDFSAVEEFIPQEKDQSLRS